MKQTKSTRFSFIIVYLFLLIVGLSIADFNPRENIIGKDVYNISNFVQIEAETILQNGSALLDTSDINGTTFNYSSYTNSSEYWDNLNTPADINTGDITDDGTYVTVGSDGEVTIAGENITSGTIVDARIPSGITRDSELSNITPIALTGTTYSLSSCGDGEGYFYNASSSSWKCKAPAGGGTVTSITAGTGMDFSTITSTGSVDINISFLNDYYYNQTIADSTFITQATESDLNVNGSNYWDNLNTPADIAISDLSQTGESDLNVNGSNYWDNLNTESDLTPSNFLTAGNYLSYTGSTLNVANQDILDASTINASQVNNFDISGASNYYYANIINMSDESVTYIDGRSLYAELGGDQQVTISGENVTSGTIAEARLPSSLYSISLNGSNINTGTVNSAYIEDAYLSNTGDTATGDYSFDNNVFYIDSTSDKLGKDTDKPYSDLHINQSSNTNTGGITLEETGGTKGYIYHNGTGIVIEG